MAKLQRRKISSRALENRQMFAADIVQSVFVPLNETDIDTSLDSIYTATTPNASGTIASSIAITITEDGTDLYYDHWEDGYDSDPFAPASTTEVYTNLKAGDVIVLANAIDTAGPAGTHYDASDRISATGSFSVTREVSDAALGGGSQDYGGFVSVATGEYIGSQFTLPFGSDTTVDSATPFSYTSLHIVAYQNLTSVQLDIGGTVYDFGGLAAGQTLYIAEGVFDAQSDPVGALTAGTTLTADGDIALYAIAGSATAQDSYWFTLLPDANWSNDYYVPVSTVSASTTEAVSLIVYNDNAASLVLNVDTLDETGAIVSQNITIAANSTETLTGLTSGARLYSAFNENFGVLGITGDADWGFTPVSASLMSTEFFIGQAADADLTTDSNPIWVTSNGVTRVYVTGTDQISVVDSYGVSIAVEQASYLGETVNWFLATELASYRIFNTDPDSNSGLDQSGLKVYTDGRAKIAVAYGADPTAVGSSYNLGNTLIQPELYPFSQSIVESTDISNNLDGQVQLGEEVEVSVRFENLSGSPINDWSISDFLTDTATSTLVDGSITLTINNPISGQETIVLTADQLRSGIDWQLATANGTNLEVGAELLVTYRLTIVGAVNDTLINDNYSLVGAPSLSFQRPDGENYTTTSLTAVAIDVPVIFEPSTNSSLSVPINRDIAGTLIDAFNQKLVFKPQAGEGIASVTIQGQTIDLTSLPTSPATTVDTLGGELRLDSFDASTGVLMFAYSAQVAGTDTIAVVLVDTAGVTSNYDLVFDVIPDLVDPNTVTLGVVSDLASITEGGSAAITFTLPSLNINTSTPLEGWRTVSIDLSGSPGTLINDENLMVALGSQFTGAYGVLTLTGFDLSTGQFDFTYVSDPLLDHSNGNLTETFTFSAQDLNFYPAIEATLDITISAVDTYPAPSVPITQSFTGLSSDDGLAQLGELVEVSISFQNQSGATISDWSISDFLTDTNSSTLLDAGITLSITNPPAAVEVINLTADQLRSGIDWQLALVNGSNLAAGALVEVTYTLKISDSIDSTLVANGYQLSSEPQLSFRDADGDASSTSAVTSVPVDVPVIFEPSDNWSLDIPSNRDVSGAVDLQNQRLLLSPQNGPLLSSTVTIAGVSVNLAGLAASTDQTIVSANGGVLTLTNLVVSADGGAGELFFDYTANAFASAYVDSVPVTLNDGVNTTTSYNLDFSIIPPITAPVLTLAGSGATLSEGDPNPLSGIALSLTPVSGWNSLTLGSEAIIKDGISVANGTTFSGTYGVLTLVSANTSTGVFNFSYLSDPSLDHTNGPLLSEIFTFSAIDISGNSPTAQTLTINILDTNQTASNDAAGTASSVALLEDRLKVFSGSVRINDTDSADGLNAIVGVIAGNSDLTPKDDIGTNDSIIVDGDYGQLEMFASGQYTYKLNNADVKVQGLGTGEVVTDVFTYTSADTDADLTNNLNSYSTATLTINIGGQDDPIPNIYEPPENYQLSVPQYREIYNQYLFLETQGAAEVKTLTIDGTEFQLSDLEALNPTLRRVETEYGEIELYDYDALTGELTFSYRARISITATDNISIQLVDTLNESTSYNLDYNVIPTFAPVSLSVSVDGAAEVNEGAGVPVDITLSSSTIQGLRTLTVGTDSNTYSVIFDGQFVMLPDTELAVDQGTLRFVGFDDVTEEFTFTYSSNTPLDHSAGTLQESLRFVARDFNSYSDTEVLNINVLDTAPLSGSDVVPGTPVVEDDVALVSYTGTLQSLLDNDTDSADGPTIIVGIEAGNTTGTGPVDTRPNTEMTATGLYGTLVVNSATGDYTYTINNDLLAVQRLKTGEVVTETFTYTAADADADITANPTSFDKALLTIQVGGTDDSPPSLSESPDNWALNIPVGLTIDSQQLILETVGNAEVDRLKFTPTSGLVTEVLLTDLENLDPIAEPPNLIVITTQYGEITLTSYSAAGVLEFSYINNSSVSSPQVDSVSIELLDTFNETTSYDLEFDVIPVIDPPAVLLSGGAAVDEGGSTLTGISVEVLPAEGWKTLIVQYGPDSASSMTLVEDSALQVAVTQELIGDYGILRLVSVDPQAGLFNFEYISDSATALDHTNNTWADDFTFLTTDLLDRSNNAVLSINILDTAQSPANDSVPGIPVAEDGNLIYTGTLQSLLDNDTNSSDGFLAIVNVEGGDTTGDLPIDALGQGSSVTATGLYGTLVIDADTGEYTYTLNNNLPAVQQLKTDEVVIETFTYTTADQDADTETNATSFGKALLTIQVGGLDDPSPEIIFSESNSTLEIPENGSVTEQTLTIVSQAGVENLTVNTDLVSEMISETVLLTLTPSSPLSIPTSFGRLIITGYELDGNGSSLLSYGYEPNDGTVNSPITDTIELVVTDKNAESTSSNLSFNLLPAIGESGPSISITDLNGSTDGQVTVDEGNNYAGIEVFVSPGIGWNQISVEGQNVVLASQPQIFDGVGVTIAGEYGNLVLRDADRSAGRLVFDYFADPVIDHSSGTLFDSFVFSATDLLGNPALTESTLSILVNDTVPEAIDDEYYDEDDRGVVTEGDPGDPVQTFTGNVISNSSSSDIFSKDNPHSIVGLSGYIDQGGGLIPFTNNNVGAKGDAPGVPGLYGTLWMDPDGNFTYELNNDLDSTQQLGDRVYSEIFIYVLADSDAATRITADGVSDSTGYSAALLTIGINGEDDPVPEVTIGENNVQVAVSSGNGVTSQTLQTELSPGARVATISVANQEIPLSSLAEVEAVPIVLPVDQGVMTITGYSEVDGIVIIEYSFDSTSTISGLQQIKVAITDSKGGTGEITIGILVTPPLMTEIPQITRTDLLEVDATGTLVRPVYNQVVGEPSVQPVTPVIFDAAQVFNGEFEPSDIIDDRSIGLESVRPNEVEERDYEAFLDLFEAPSRLERDTGGIEPFDVDAYELKAQKNIPPQLLGIESREIEYLIPNDTFLHTDERATISLSVTLLDGSALPAWLNFNPNTAGFTGIAPADVSGEFIFKVIARDDEGRQAETLMRLIVDDAAQTIETVGDNELLEQTPESNQTTNESAGAAGEVNAAT